MKKLLILSLAFFAMACGGKQTVDLGESKVDVPAWFMNPPTSDDAIYGTARQESRDMQIAIDKAKNIATTDIAKKMEVRVQAMVKQYAEEVGELAEDASLRQYFEQVSKLVVDETLAGVELDKNELLTKEKEGKSIYISYVLMRMNFDTANKILLGKIKNQEELYTKFQSSKAFKELEAEVEKLNKN